MAKFLDDGLKTSARLVGVAMYITMENFDCDEFRRQIDSLLPPEVVASELSTIAMGE